MQDPIYNRIKNQPRPTLFAASGVVLLAAVGLWISSLLESLLPNASLALANALYYLPFMVLPVGLYALRRPGLGDAMRLKAVPVLPTLSAALLGLLTVYVASLLSAAWGACLDALGLHGLGGVAVPRNERELLLDILALAAMPAICEELLFRGFVLSAWESRGTRFAIGVTAALFALLHGNLYGIPAYLLVGAVAALHSHKPPLIVVDMGTATTISVIDGAGRFLGGAIAPGVKLSLNALSGGTSLLPHISLDAPKKCIGTNTIACMQSGSIFGTAAMLDGMIDRMEKELGCPATVVATGGLAGSVIPCCSHEIVYDENLLLEGLAVLWEKNRKDRK